VLNAKIIREIKIEGIRIDNYAMPKKESCVKIVDYVQGPC
jgi:hypothetical protein